MKLLRCQKREGDQANKYAPKIDTHDVDSGQSNGSTGDVAGFIGGIADKDGTDDQSRRRNIQAALLRLLHNGITQPQFANHAQAAGHLLKH